jgi:hypothetical protein
MAAIVTLATPTIGRYRGGRHVAKPQELEAELLALRTKLNEVIGRFNAGTLDQIRVVGADAPPYYGTAAEKAKFNVDGINPPTVEAIRFQDQTTGAYRELTIADGHIYLDGVLLI